METKIQADAGVDIPKDIGGESRLNNNGIDTILVVEDDPFNRVGVVMYFQQEGYKTLEAGDENTALQIAQREQPSAAVIDIVIPTYPDREPDNSQSVGLRLLRQLKADNPALPIVVLSAHDDRGAEVWEMVSNGMRGLAYMLKGGRPERLLHLLKESVAGHVTLEPDTMTSPAQLVDEIRNRLSPEERPWVEEAQSRLHTLSKREWDVALLLTDSQNTRGIAEQLHISQRTVENHIASIYKKIGFGDLDSQAPSLRRSTLFNKAVLLYKLSNLDDPDE